MMASSEDNLLVTVVSTAISIIVVSLLCASWIRWRTSLKKLTPQSENSSKNNDRPPLRQQQQNDETPTRLPTCREEARILQPIQINGMTLKNRVVRAAAFGGSNIDELVRTHSEVARGGVAMTTVAYASVSPDGRTFREQLLLTEDNAGVVPALRKLTKAVHEAGSKISIQLTHAGSFSDRKVTGIPQIAPSAIFNAAGFDFAREMTRSDMDRVSGEFATAASLAKRSGFDAVELHCCHGYLLSQFICPKTNLRNDKYGGPPIENRLRFPLEVLRHIRKTVGPDFPVFVKMNLHDGFPGGVSLGDAVESARSFAAASADCLVLSGGFVSRNGFYMLRGKTPHWSMARAMGSVTKGLALVLFGRWLVPEIPFEECFFRDRAREVLRACRSDENENINGIPICLLGGVVSLSNMERAMDDGFSLVQMARALIQNPSLVNEISGSLPTKANAAAGVADIEDVRSECTHCNDCVVSTLDPSIEMKCKLKKKNAAVVHRDDRGSSSRRRHRAVVRQKKGNRAT